MVLTPGHGLLRLDSPAAERSRPGSLGAGPALVVTQEWLMIGGPCQGRVVGQLGGDFRSGWTPGTTRAPVTAKSRGANPGFASPIPAQKPPFILGL